jgi:hypothetical protein
MTRLLALAPAALALAASTGRAQAPDSLAEAGYREGRAAAQTRGVGGYGVLGTFTGFVAGFAGVPLLILGRGPPQLLGALLIVPVVWTYDAARSSQPTPPPDLAARLATQPASYQQTFRTEYAAHLARRRARAARIAGIGGSIIGVGAFVGFVIHLINNSEDW